MHGPLSVCAKFMSFMSFRKATAVVVPEAAGQAAGELLLYR